MSSRQRHAVMDIWREGEGVRDWRGGYMDRQDQCVVSGNIEHPLSLSSPTEAQMGVVPTRKRGHSIQTSST